MIKSVVNQVIHEVKSLIKDFPWSTGNLSSIFPCGTFKWLGTEADGKKYNLLEKLFL